MDRPVKLCEYCNNAAEKIVNGEPKHLAEQAEKLKLLSEKGEE